jgi:hypothetical protein
MAPALKSAENFAVSAENFGLASPPVTLIASISSHRGSRKNAVRILAAAGINHHAAGSQRYLVRFGVHGAEPAESMESNRQGPRSVECGQVSAQRPLFTLCNVDDVQVSPLF